MIGCSLISFGLNLGVAKRAQVDKISDILNLHFSFNVHCELL